MRVGALHTVPGLVPVFHSLLTELDPGLDVVHTTDPALLAGAIERGVDDALIAAVADHLRGLARSGATSVLVTCSSIGEAAVEAGSRAGVPVVRVDAAMGAEAVTRASRGGGRVLVLATLEATLGPTTRLVEASAHGKAVEVTAHLVVGAADARARGDQAVHDRLIAEAIAEARDVEAIVLAQASMATGAGDDSRVLTSPRSGSAAFVAGLSAGS
ncbi:hypothetical protein G5T42_11610 [Microbacterium sp. 4R-513]|uniref:aspartate/glutamate racemase family protein n=1 Tax=Microbacterium sp. 4R-513 TaxID=2567934 RepID=UPI0013E1AE5C|nr:aspartate/glutamate racemase family protein [Microbacterium sp. 4R-513]QIG40048.1 hypothetical protein G5T42_11610 [Microbacterium sp. 4R-513]